jgi:LysR family nitrogen assimilation transcriptional regulator
VDGHQLRCFLATAELGSVTRAAGRLDIAQPTLSQILLRLEDELGIKLFERTARGVHLTDPGRVFQEHARIILRDMDRARAEVRLHDAAAPAAVSIGLPSSISGLVGARLVVAARERLPKVAVRLDEAFSGHIRAWLRWGGSSSGSSTTRTRCTASRCGASPSKSAASSARRAASGRRAGTASRRTRCRSPGPTPAR